jgi:hypothetical protein
MEYVSTPNGLRLLGQGTALVIEVQSGTVDTHQIRINHPDFGDTVFIPYIQTAGLLKVPAVGDLVYVFCNEGFQNYPMAWGTKLHDSAVKALLGTRDNRATIIYATGKDHKTISHTIILDDGDNRGVRIKTHGGNNIEIKDVDDIIITQLNGNTITMNSSGINMISANTINIRAKEINLEASGSKIKIDQTINGKASDDKATFDKVIISTHDQLAGNLGYPTSLGPTKEGT